MKKIIRAIICAYRGHRLPVEMEFWCYVRDGRRFTKNGRFFKCKCCGAWMHKTGLLQRELVELIEMTLKSLPTTPLEMPTPKIAKLLFGEKI